MIKSLLQIYRIIRWHKKTFPDFDCYMQELKLADEIREYLNALEHYINTHQAGDCVKEELADIVIAATNLYRFPEMRQLINEKMKINLSRKWHNGQHEN